MSSLQHQRLLHCSTLVQPQGSDLSRGNMGTQERQAAQKNSQGWMSVWALRWGGLDTLRAQFAYYIDLNAEAGLLHTAEQGG